MFSKGPTSRFVDFFEEPVWLSQLAYLLDIFSCLNELNVGRQGLTVNAFDVQDKISALIKEKKCSPLKSKSGDVLAFPALESVFFFFFVRK